MKTTRQINFDVLTNFGALHLFVDPTADLESEDSCGAESFECRRAPNGNCLLAWSTIYESPGKHALQAGLFVEDPDDSENDLIGPPTPYVVSNLCQFSTTSASFDPAFGPTLRARLSEPRGDYILEIKSPAGNAVKTISGLTTNGIIAIHWDLKDDHGNTCTNQSFDTFFHIRLPSGRSQTLKGP